MYNYLKDHALKNVWCTPDQDNQLIIEPFRLTTIGGAIRRFKVMWRTIALPDTVSYWHIFQIGQIYPLLVGLLPKTNIWQSLSSTSNSRKMICDIYVNSGIQIPRFDTWYMYTEDNDLILAVKDNKKLDIDFDAEKIFLRVYTNAYFNSLRSDALNDTVHTEGIQAKTLNEILILQYNYQQYKAKPGQTYAFVNGIKINDIDLSNMVIGDIGEFVYDSSIIRVVDFKIGDLNVFTSTMDSKLKYLLHYAGVTDNTIDYRDDIDFFIIDPLLNNRHRGVYYHKNQNDAVRMLTHKDYSVPTAYVAGYTNTLQKVSEVNRTIDPKNLYLRLHIRKSGYLRPLIFEHNRIMEMYKMQDTDIIRAMLGIDSTVDNWKAEVLEESAYVKIMDSNCCDITPQMVQEAYGYNSISSIIGYTPQVPYNFSGRKIVDVPYGLQINSTVYEYDRDGLLLQWIRHPIGSRYACINPATELVEIIGGVGSDVLSDIYAFNNIPVDTTKNFRVYFSASAGVLNDWVDITGTDKYVVINNILKQTVAVIVGLLLIRNESKFLSYDINIPIIDGELKFYITQVRDIDGVPTKVEMEVPNGELDIFLNGRSLIRDLDYFIHFPQVVIVNKEYLVVGDQAITIRHTGFCDTDLKISKASDIGFIEHGLLSNNNIFDLRDDKVLRIVIDGKLYARDELIFSELTGGVSILNPINGNPYAIRDIIVPLNGLTTDFTQTVKSIATEVDINVSEYLTLKIPEPIRLQPSAILDRYQIFSPFICKIIYALVNETFDISKIQGTYNDNDVLRFCKPYEYLLKFDPTQQMQAVDSNYVVIHPHNLLTVIDLELYKYSFIQKVVKLYTNDLVILSPFLRLKII